MRSTKAKQLTIADGRAVMPGDGTATQQGALPASGAAMQAGRRRLAPRAFSRLYGAIRFSYPLVLCCVVWQLVAMAGFVDPLVLPSFSKVAATLYNGLVTTGAMWTDVAATLRRASVGFAIAVVIGVTAGLAMAGSRAVRGFLDPIISATFPAPKMALFPILLIWLGTGETSKITLVVLGAVYPVIINTYSASTSINRYIMWNARSKGANRWQMLVHVVLPAAMPQIVAAMRIASATAFLLAVGAELLSSSNGLGFLIMSSQESFQPEVTLAALVLTGLLGLTIDRVVVALGNRTSRWQEGST